MKIIKKKGNKWKEDYVFFINSNGEEAFAMDKLLLLVNQLALNEFNGFREKGYEEKEYPFFFEDAVEEVIKLGKEGINLLDNANEPIVKQLCEKYRLPFTKWKQTTLEVFT